MSGSAKYFSCASLALYRVSQTTRAVSIAVLLTDFNTFSFLCPPNLASQNPIKLFSIFKNAPKGLNLGVGVLFEVFSNVNMGRVIHQFKGLLTLNILAQTKVNYL